MKKLILAGMAMVSVAALSGCSTARFVTARSWVGGDTLYVAYTQFDQQILTSSFEAKVLRCNRQADNSLTCADEADLNALLNKDSATAK